MINCGAIPETLLESELFGYESGAFTGARREGKPGMFEMAEKGTLFLDEIGDISFSLQAKLLRAIQDHQIKRVGGLKPIAVDARIIAATNKNLHDMVQAGSFRDDLYYRLNVVAIEIPPLRERKEDIPLLVLHFLKKINEKYRFQKRIGSEVVDSFMVYQWPGNIRELENVIERMLVMTEEEEIKAKDLPHNLRSQVYPNGKPFVMHENLPFKKAIERTEKHLLEKAIKTHGSTRKVARALRINQSTVVRKLKKYNLSSLCRDLDEPASPFEDLKFRL
jgi:transcriptional regulator with PAS, ATPase and Fis domain